jgi:DNA-binding transcriptional MerR regulator
MDDATFNSIKDQYLSLGRFAKTGQLSRKALRLYDQLGILVPDFVDPRSGYRYYSPDQLERARFIRLLRGMEMPLADIHRVLAAATTEEAIELVNTCASEFETRVTRVRRASQKVIAHLRKEPDQKMFEISVKSFPSQRVATIKKHIRVRPFQQFIPEALKLISAYVKESGAQVDGDPFCFYHGPVNESDDGPVEIGLPVKGKIEPGGEIRVSDIPAHHGVIGITPLEQSQFPEIIEAWDAVVAWVQDNKFKMSDEPVCCYEIWHEDHTITIVQPFENGGES